MIKATKKETMTTTTSKNEGKINILMIGTGEYTTGYVGGTAADSDKGAGVVALTVFDMRRRGKVNRIAMCGVNGKKFPGIRKHMEKQIKDAYKDMDISCDTYPSDNEVNPESYKVAIATFSKGDVAIIFTPDDTHYDIAKCCIQHGLHVLITKPIVQTLNHHKTLHELSANNNVLVGVEVHKRLDPFYSDARDKISSGSLGCEFQYLYAYMSQPKHQLDTFKAWAGKSSDISYYLNSHHIDFTEWCLHNKARPVRVIGTSSTGIASRKDGIVDNCEDSITLTVQWENIQHKTLGCAIYTSSWVAPKSDVHSQQRFFYMGSKGEVNVDQAHRGCTVAIDNTPFASVNPLFMKYTPNPQGYFAGQLGYGVRSIENFVDASVTLNDNTCTISDYDRDGTVATVGTTMQGTAILEAGRRSLDCDGRPMSIVYDDNCSIIPKDIVPVVFN